MKVLSLVLHSEHLSNVLDGIRERYGQLNSPSKAHVTVRGPFKNISGNVVSRTQGIVSSEGFSLCLQGTGIFILGDMCFVYVRVLCDLVRPIWRKPDYPLRDGYFNPHVTIYRGRDRLAAHDVLGLYSEYSELVQGKDVEVALDSIGQSELDF